MSERLSLGSTFAPLSGTAVPGAVAPVDETLVVDARAQLSPAEMVERQLITRMRGMPVHVSHTSAQRRR